MARTDDAGAVAAAEYFMEVHEWAYQTGDLGEWDTISGQTCAFCRNVHDAVVSIYGDGGRAAGGSTTFSDIQVTGFDEQLLVYSVRLAYSTGETVVYRADGSAKGVYNAEDATLTLEVGPSVRGWVLLEGTGGGDAA
jgi:hypothetical protein